MFAIRELYTAINNLANTVHGIKDTHDEKLFRIFGHLEGEARNYNIKKAESERLIKYSSGWQADLVLKASACK